MTDQPKMAPSAPVNDPATKKADGTIETKPTVQEPQAAPHAAPIEVKKV
jgi:hypothetical protein